jgi:hypothetical protein
MIVRLSEKIENIGYFWLPENTEQKLPGTLRLSESGKAFLEVVGHFGEQIDAINGSPNLGRIVGILEKGELVTLDGCSYSNRNISFGGVSKCTIRANLALIGANFEKDHPLAFSKVSFSLEGLDEWLEISGIKVTLNLEETSAVIKYEPPQELSLSLPDDIRLSFEFGWTVPSLGNLKEAKVTQKAYVSLESNEIRPLHFFKSLIFKITNFFCFAINEIVGLESVTGFYPELKIEIPDGKSYEVPIKMYYESLPFSEKKPKLDLHSMLFRYCHITTDIEKILTKWLNNYEVSEPAFNLYFASKSGGHKYLDGRFLSLAQGIETLHRRNSNETLMQTNQYSSLMEQLIASCQEEHKSWLNGKLKFGNELSLRARLKQMLAPFHRFFGETSQQKYLISKIIDTRNYLTHYDPCLETSAAKGVELLKISFKLEWLFQLHFLRLIGMTDEEIDRVASNNQRFQINFESN